MLSLKEHFQKKPTPKKFSCLPEIPVKKKLLTPDISVARVQGEDSDSASVQLQFREIIDTIEFEKQAGHGMGFREAARNPANRKRVYLAMSVAPLAMMTGSNVIT